MKYPNCQTENREGAEFCGECGKSLQAEPMGEVEEWRLCYDGERLHGTLGNITTMEYLLTGDAIN